MQDCRIDDGLVEEVRKRGPITVAAFMDLALYDPRFGYYARAAQRSGRAGDFFTSVDVGALFGRLLAVQFVEMASLISISADAAKNKESTRGPAEDRQTPPFDLVEAGAGNGRLSADVLRAIRDTNQPLYDRTRLHLVEASPAARAAQPDVLADVTDRLSSSSTEIPASFEGLLFANELIDALPVHQVVMREEGLREVFVDVRGDRLLTIEQPPSTSALAAYLERLGVVLEPGWRVEIGLAAVHWMREAARRLRRGFIVLIDYGHPARELYSVTHSSGTLTSFSRHSMAGPETLGTHGQPPWLSAPGDQDMTAHVDFTSIQLAAEAEGMRTLAFLDQTYFLMGLCAAGTAGSPVNLVNPANLKERLALKTLLMPGGLGSTMKVLILGKNVGTPALLAGSFRMRVT